jgi:flavin reductase (DIM6/NTAB) family NADH-FMN oxidoreductase RutF
MQMIDLTSKSPVECYKLLTGLIVPRPIAWVTTLSDNGEVNAAPFSYFNVLGSNPPMVIIGTGRRPDGSLKDTAHNLKERKEAVIHLVEEDLAEQMSATSAGLPHGESEIPHAGLALEDSPDFSVPSIKGTRARLHARLIDQPVYGENFLNVLEIIAIILDNEIYDAATGRILDAHAPVGRLAGDSYCRSKDRFLIKR